MTINSTVLERVVNFNISGLLISSNTKWDCLIFLNTLIFFFVLGILMLAHHILSIFGNALVVYEGRFGTEMIAVIFGAEFTNPFLQMRWFLRHSDRHLTWYGELNDFLFIVLFGLMRLVIGTNLLVCYWAHPKPPLLTKLGGTIFYLVGWIFFVFIIQYSIRKYGKLYKQWRNKNTKHSGKTHITNGNSNHTNGTTNLSNGVKKYN